MISSGVRPQCSIFAKFPEEGGASAATRETTNQRDATRGQEGGEEAGRRARRMVACAVAASAVHPSSSSSVVGGGGERRAAPPLASPEVSRAAAAPLLQLKMGLTPAASIEQLKQQLQTAIENKDSEKATLAIEELERVNLSREILESTRIGLSVNNARKDMGDMWPPLAKRCRGLIKGWQKLVEPTTNSSSASTSRNGTPSLVSPAVGRRLTPHTPANKRITPGVASERASNLSPANGSYAPKTVSNLLSPGLGMHKSHSVGFDLKDENGGGGGGVRNGKRKQDEPATGTPPSSIKRAKTTASGLNVGALTSPAPNSLIEKRAAVLSTFDLVAQLTRNHPQQHDFEDAAKAHEEKVKRELEDQQLAAALANGGEPAQSPYVFDKKRKYERKKPLTGTPSTPLHSSASASSSSTTTVRIVTPPPDEAGRKGGIVLKLSLSRTTTDTGSLAQQAVTPATGLDKKEEKERRKREKREAAALHASKSAPALALMDEAASTSSPAAAVAAASSPWSQHTASSSSAASSIGGSNGEKKKEKIDWNAMVPSIEELQKRVDKDKDRRRVLEGIKDSEKAYTLHVGDRVVLALPYIEIEDRPDFLKFNYPDPGRFYAEENFIGGLMERPVHPPPAAPAAAAAGSAPAVAAGQK